ncbi:MAG: hypothetical protein KC731_32135 [Myxococcales bacterium]|nr:hypothetical protein [Myxococcales bacterium]
MIGLLVVVGLLPRVALAQVGPDDTGPAPVTIVLPAPAPAPVVPAPAAPALPPGMRNVWVHIDSEIPGIELRRHLRGHDDGRRWHTVCVAPCDSFVSTYDDTHFLFDGPGMVAAPKFQLGPIGYGRYAVHPGSTAQWALGWVAVGVGGTGFLGGVVALVFAGTAAVFVGGNDDIEDIAIAGGVATAAGAGVALGAGLPLLLTARSSYELYDSGPTVGLGPTGLRVDF